MTVKLTFEGNKHIEYNNVIDICEIGNIGEWIQIKCANGVHFEYMKSQFDSIEIYKYNV